MHRPLFDKDKALQGIAKDGQNQSTQTASGAALPEKTPTYTQNIGGYGPASADLSSASWRKSHLALHETWYGRAAMRSFSRGILGAAAFAWGGHYASRSQGLKGTVFNREIGQFEQREYSFDFSKENHNNWFVRKNWNKPLVVIARGIDEVVARPLRWAATVVTGDRDVGERFVRFRPMSMKYSGRFSDAVGGRSLGEEVIGITFDFFCASIGDAFGRDVVDFFDPNAKKSWIDNNNNIRPGEALKTAGKTAWRYLTYNGGEDWAVAIPYAYFMKAQRSALNKLSPGFKLDANESGNGTAYKVAKVRDENGNIVGSKVIGDYNFVGAMDLQSRFTVYNIGTLMYREAYDWVGNRLRGIPTNLYGDPNVHHEHHGLRDTATGLAKWAARSIVKGTMVMTPAVPFFWITRVPQGSYKGTFIDPTDQSMLTYSKGNEHDPSLPQYGLVKELLETRAQDPYYQGKTKFHDQMPVGFRKFTGVIDPIHSPNGWRAIGSPSVGINPFHGGFEAYNYPYKRGVMSTIMRPIGKLNNAVRTRFRHSMEPHVGPVAMSRFINASASYTPYMYMKAETANLFDNGKMDMAAERMIDGAFSLNKKEFKAGLGEVWRSMLQQPLRDPVREAQAQYRIKADTSAADASLRAPADVIEEDQRIRAIEAKEKGEDTNTPDLNNANGTAPQANIPWEQRVIQGRSSQKADGYAAAMAPSTISNAEREKMRKFLTEAVPPSNSRH